MNLVEVSGTAGRTALDDGWQLTLTVMSGDNDRTVADHVNVVFPDDCRGLWDERMTTALAAFRNQLLEAAEKRLCKKPREWELFLNRGLNDAIVATDGPDLREGEYVTVREVFEK